VPSGHRLDHRLQPERAGQEAIFQSIRGAEKHVIHGSNHSTIFDNSVEHNRVVIDFFQRHNPD
jgi:pimeloyl-ACP methyl ester carboxylesterase